jgi:hypothetical protein
MSAPTREVEPPAGALATVPSAYTAARGFGSGVLPIASWTWPEYVTLSAFV